MKQEQIDSREDALPLELVIRDSCGAKAKSTSRTAAI